MKKVYTYGPRGTTQKNICRDREALSRKRKKKEDRINKQEEEKEFIKKVS